MLRGNAAFLFSLLGSLATTSFAQVTLPTLRVTAETAPAGGMAQVKVLLTSPKPILLGDGFVDLSGVDFASIDGIEMFSPTGDVLGTAVLNGTGFKLNVLSPNGTYGTNVDYPVLTAAVRLAPTASGTMPVNIDGSVFGYAPGTYEYKPGSITVAGTATVTNILPGGGFFRAGSTVRIEGMNFSPKTKVNVNGLLLASTKYASPTELEVKLSADGILDGAEFIVKNPDGSKADYFSYLRGIAAGKTANALLAKTVPIFPMNPVFEATIANAAPATSPGSPVSANYFFALAVQNPGSATAPVTIELQSSTQSVIASTSFSLGAGNKIQRQLAEWFGSNAALGASLRIVSTQPVQVMGLVGDIANAAVQPVAVTVVRAPAPISLPPIPHGTSGKAI